MTQLFTKPDIQPYLHGVFGELYQLLNHIKLASSLHFHDVFKISVRMSNLFPKPGIQPRLHSVFVLISSRPS